MYWDDRILANFKRGDMDLFYDKVYPGLLLYAQAQLGVQREYLAEDCVQEAVFNAWRRKDSFMSVYTLKSFLYTVIRNDAISLHRKKSAHNRYLLRDDVDAPNDNLLVTDLETQAILFNAINDLPEKLRLVTELSFVEGLKNREIADRLSISLSSVNQYKAESIKILRGRLKPSLLFLLYIRIF